MLSLLASEMNRFQTGMRTSYKEDDRGVTRGSSLRSACQATTDGKRNGHYHIKEGFSLKTWINRAKLWTTGENCAKVRSDFFMRVLLLACVM